VIVQVELCLLSLPIILPLWYTWIQPLSQFSVIASLHERLSNSHI